MSQDEYISHLVEREIATSQEVLRGMFNSHVEADPMARFLPWILLVTLLVTLATTAASLSAVLFF